MRRRAALLAFGAAALGALDCSPGKLPPTGQLVLYFDTDAPVPPGGGKSLAPTDPRPLFDTLRVEVFAPGASEPCAGCVREFSVDADKFVSEQGVSVGIPAKPGVSGYRARASLFLHSWVVPCAMISEVERAGIAACASDPQARVPHPATVLSRTVRLPAVATDVVSEVSVFLDTESVGVPNGTLEAPASTTPGKPKSSQVGKWAGAKRAACKTAPRADEACVPSGAFWQGNPKVYEWGHAIISPHLVVLSAFFMKKAEVTVAECRGVPGCNSEAAQSAPVLGAWCDYRVSPGATEKLPINCVRDVGRSAYCKAWGGDVASLAELEYAGRGTVGSTYVWGEDDPTCDDAMWGRADENTGVAKGPCYRLPGGPYVGGSGKRDRLVLDTGTIVDLGGNLQEWTRDSLPNDCKCAWPPGVLHDPTCQDPSGNKGAIGGSWTYGAGSLALTVGGCGASDFIASMNGFRCARPDQ